MKRSQLLIGLIAWSASLILAFAYGRSGGAPEAESPEKRNQANRKTYVNENKPVVDPSNSEQSADLDARASEANSVLTTYFEGSEVPLSDALAEINRLSASQTRDFLEAAFALPASDPHRSELITALLSQLAKSNPQEAYGLTASIGSLRDAERAKVAILEVWAKNDPVTAIAWAQSALADEPRHLYSSQMSALFRGYAELDPEAAFAAAQSLPADSRDEQRMRNQLMSEVIETQVREGEVTQAKLAIELVTDPDTKERMTQELVSEWAKYDPASAALYIDSLGESASSRLKTSLVDEWAESDPAAAALWLSSLDVEDPTVARAANDIIQEWTRYDLVASAEWLNTLPASADLDRAVVGYTYRAAQEDPASAMSWAESVSNDRVRDRIMQNVASSWKSENPEAFEEYVESADLTDEQKEDLRTAENRGGGGGRSAFGRRRE